MYGTAVSRVQTKWRTEKRYYYFTFSRYKYKFSVFIYDALYESYSEHMCPTFDFTDALTI